MYEHSPEVDATNETCNLTRQNLPLQSHVELTYLIIRAGDHFATDVVEGKTHVRLAGIAQARLHGPQICHEVWLPLRRSKWQSTAARGTRRHGGHRSVVRRMQGR